MTSFIDTHCHLDKLSSTPEEAVSAAKQAGVEQVITIAVDEASLDFVSGTAQKFPEVYGSLGFHPHDAAAYSEVAGERISTLVRQNSKIVAIGEIGLDYHYEYSPREVQQQVFRKQLEIAVELGLPVILHSREAEADTLRILEEIPLERKGVAHSFTSSLETAKILVETGWYLGINGIVTFKNADDLREVVSWLPLENLLLETDAPFLSPVPFRGKPNQPARIPAIAEFIAELRGVPFAQLAEQTSENVHKLFDFS